MNRMGHTGKAKQLLAIESCSWGVRRSRRRIVGHMTEDQAHAQRAGAKANQHHDDDKNNFTGECSPLCRDTKGRDDDCEIYVSEDCRDKKRR